MTKEEIKDKIIDSQDKYIVYLKKLCKINNITWDISINARNSYESELADLKKQLEECNITEPINLGSYKAKVKLSEPENIKLTHK